MLLSMTGFGDARRENETLRVAVEVRSVNNRYLKVVTRCPDTHAALEGELERVVRESIGRGTVSLVVHVRRVGFDQQYVLNQDVLEDYWRQLSKISERIPLGRPSEISHLLELPGVVTESDRSAGDPHADWPLIEETLKEALERLQTFRLAEGRSMQDELSANVAAIAERVSAVAEMAPQVVSDYRSRILERIRELLQGTEVSVEESNLIREVSIFADRCDINEEIIRLRSHLEQFRSFLEDRVSQGRKLDFLTQELFREVNTIGSKANNVAIAHAVVDMKGAVEKIREILQNVE